MSSNMLIGLTAVTLGAVAGASNMIGGEIDLLSALALGAGAGAWLGCGLGILVGHDPDRATAGGAALGMLGLGVAVILALIQGAVS
jgi:hypothetical protein